MITLVIGSLVLSILHALIPNHWLPIIAIGRKENWTLTETTSVTLVAGSAHALSTVLIGVALGFLGLTLAETISNFTHIIAPIILVALGLFYIYQHHRHKHFHLNAEHKRLSKNKLIASLAIAMFFSPCFEIEAYFLMAGTHGWSQIVFLAFLYTIVTIAGMVIWVRLTFKGLIKLNWHSLEHNSGVITGTTLVITGIISFFLH